MMVKVLVRKKPWRELHVPIYNLPEKKAPAGLLAIKKSFAILIRLHRLVKRRLCGKREFGKLKNQVSFGNVQIDNFFPAE